MNGYNLTKIVMGKRLELFFQAKSTDERQKLRNDCLRKRRYKTFIEAGKVARHFKEKQNKELRIYLCKHCKGYHLTGKKLKSNHVNTR